MSYNFCTTKKFNMNPIHSTKKDNPGGQQISSEQIQESIHSYPHEINITDGSEFLDDGIRMKDQPFGETTAKENQ